MFAARFFHHIPTGVPRWVKYTVTLVLLALLVRQIDWAAMVAEFAAITPWWIAPYVAVIVTGNAISAYRWWFLARLQGFRAPLWRYFTLYVTSSFVNNFLPSFLGGDAYRAYMLGRTRPDGLLPATFSVVVDRAVGLLAGLFVASVSGLLWIATTPLAPPRAVVVLLVLTIAVCALGGAAFVWRNRIVRFLARAIGKKYVAYAALAQVYTTPRLLYALGWGGVFMLFGVALANYLLFLAFGLHLPVLPFVFAVLVASVIAAAPISIGNIGVKEWAYITLFGMLGVPASSAVAVVFLGRVLQALISTLGVPFYFWGDARVRKDALKEAQR